LTAFETMRAGHKAILAASAKAVLANAGGFLLPVAGDDGMFLCSATVGRIKTGDVVIFPRADTWLLKHMTERAPARPVSRATDPGDRLGSYWLAPLPCRRRTADGRHEVLTVAL
jgi:hypothetical protein